MSSAICISCQGKFQGGGARCAQCMAKRKVVEPVKKREPFYGTAAWRKFSDWYKRQHPLCENCKAKGIVTPVYCVDHVIEIKDGGALLSSSNSRSLCRRCHARKTAFEAIRRA